MRVDGRIQNIFLSDSGALVCANHVVFKLVFTRRRSSCSDSLLCDTPGLSLTDCMQKLDGGRWRGALASTITTSGRNCRAREGRLN